MGLLVCDYCHFHRTAYFCAVQWWYIEYLENKIEKMMRGVVVYSSLYFLINSSSSSVVIFPSRSIYKIVSPYRSRVLKDWFFHAGYNIPTKLRMVFTQKVICSSPKLMSGCPINVRHWLIYHDQYHYDTDICMWLYIFQIEYFDVAEPPFIPL